MEKIKTASMLNNRASVKPFVIRLCDRPHATIKNPTFLKILALWENFPEH